LWPARLYASTRRRDTVTADQIEDWHLPTRPTKKSDTRAKHFQDESVEVDAIDPDTLRTLVRDCIEEYVDERKLKVMEVAEASERELLEKLAASIGKDKGRSKKKGK
jgi:hypothetical protein